jgi:hypothetical protein
MKMSLTEEMKMSLMGLRPSTFDVDRYADWNLARLAVPSLDCRYIKEQSILLDLWEQQRPSTQRSVGESTEPLSGISPEQTEGFTRWWPPSAGHSVTGVAR